MYTPLELGALLLALDRESGLEWIDALEWLFASSLVLVGKLGPMLESAGESARASTTSRFSFVKEAMRRNAVNFLHWCADSSR